MSALRIALLVFLALLSVGADFDPARRDERSRLRVFEASAQQFAVAVAAQRRGDLDAAARHYQAALRDDPAFVEAMVNLARVELARGEPESAERWLDRAAEAQPGYPAIAAVRGLAALGAGDLSRAVDELGLARRRLPGDVEVLANLGAALLRRGLLTEAREVLAKAVEASPGDAVVVFNLALAEDRSGAAARAAFHYRRFLELTDEGDPQREQVRERIDLLNPRREETMR